MNPSLSGSPGTRTPGVRDRGRYTSRAVMMSPMEPLEHFEFCPRCGQRSGTPDARDRFKCPACGFMLYFNSASAVAAMILDASGRLLLIRREREPARGRLAMPGGFVDAGESAEEALLREIREEVGLELRDVMYFASYANRYLYAGVTYNTLDLFFLCASEDSSRATALDGVASVEWRDPQTVADRDIAFPSMREALRAYRARQ